MNRAAMLLSLGVLAGCTIQVPGTPMPQSFLGLSVKITDNDLAAAGYVGHGSFNGGQKWTSDSEYLIVRDGRVQSVVSADEGMRCAFDDFKRAHLSLAAAVAVLRLAEESKEGFKVNKPTTSMIKQRESEANMLRVSCTRLK